MSDKELIKQEIERLKHNTPNAYDLSRFMLLEEIEGFIDSIPKEHNEDLEEYAKKLAKGAALDKHNLIWMCKKGAEWQKQQMKEALQTEYEKGRFDMREEMMEDAVECTWGSQATSAFMSDFLNIDIGDKVKVIILKTE